MRGSTQIVVAPMEPRVGRKRINDPDEKLTARFPAGTLERINAALAPKEPQAAFIREAVERELKRRGH